MFITTSSSNRGLLSIQRVYLQALLSGHDGGRGQAGCPPTTGGLEGADGGRSSSSDRMPLGDGGRPLSPSSYGNRVTKTQLVNRYMHNTTCTCFQENRLLLHMCTLTVTHAHMHTLTATHAHSHNMCIYMYRHTHTHAHIHVRMLVYT